jgi:hypothetical protein
MKYTQSNTYNILTFSYDVYMYVFGLSSPCVQHGMLQCRFNKQNKMVAAEMMFDVMGFMQQLQVSRDDVTVTVKNLQCEETLIYPFLSLHFTVPSLPISPPSLPFLYLLCAFSFYLLFSRPFFSSLIQRASAISPENSIIPNTIDMALQPSREVHTAPSCTALHNLILHYTALHCHTALHCTVLHCTATLHCTVLHCHTALHCTALPHCTALHCHTALPHWTATLHCHTAL